VIDEIKKFNTKLCKYMKPNVRATTLEIDQDREYFSKHGQHLNGQGKENICRQLATIIGENFQRSDVTPISLGWEKNQTVGMEARTIDTHNDSKNVVLNEKVNDSNKEKESSVCRTSNRQKKVPITRKHDFLWYVKIQT
jgi:hypothetical protein